MARQANDISTVTVTISTTPPVKKLLNKLVATGLYGKNAADAAERLIARELERLMNDGLLK
jgi:hypothetical protein